MPRKTSSVCAIAAAALWAGAVGCGADAADVTSPGPQFAAGGAAGSRWVAQVVGGLRGLDVGAQRDINVLAVQAKRFADGSVSGVIQTSRLFVHPFFPSDDPVVPLFTAHGDVTCLAVDGNRAWIGAIVVRGFLDVGDPPDGTRIDLAGFQVVEFLIDNGDGTVDSQIVGAPAASCVDEPEIPDLFTFTNGNLKIMER